MLKSQARFIEHIFVIAFGFTVLTAVSLTFYTFYQNFITREVTEGLRQVGDTVSQNLLQLYEAGKASESSPKNNSIVLLFESNLKLPQQVGRRNYEVRLVTGNGIFSVISNVTIGDVVVTPIVSTSSPKILVKTTQDPIVEVEKDLPNIDLILIGKYESGVESKLKYYRANINNTITNFIILGQSSILVNITAVS